MEAENKDESGDELESFHAMLETLADRLTLLMMISIVPLFGFSLARIIQIGWQPVMYLHSLISLIAVDLPV